MVRPHGSRHDALWEGYGETNHGTRDPELELRVIKRKRPDGSTVDRTAADKIIKTRFGKRFKFYAGTSIYFVYQEVKR
jgi:hypothetical protein